MKNVINYYYGIEVNEIKKRENNFIFSIVNKNFELIEFDGDENQIIEIYSMLKTLKIRVYEIIFNKNGRLITHYENKKYVLLEKFDSDIKILNLENIVDYNMIVPVKKELMWKELWIKKLDYYEIQLQENEFENYLLRQSFNYYLGLGELAINLLNYIDYKNIVYTISHKRIEKTEDIFNPLNIIVDSKMRDIAEYIKNSFFNENLKFEEIIQFMINTKISKEESLLLMSRLIYPTYYFDIYEKLYLKKVTEKELYKIIKKNAEYEAFLKKIYTELKFLYNIPKIEFFEY